MVFSPNRLAMFTGSHSGASAFLAKNPLGEGLGMAVVEFLSNLDPNIPAFFLSIIVDRGIN